MACGYPAGHHSYPAKGRISALHEACDCMVHSRGILRILNAIYPGLPANLAGLQVQHVRYRASVTLINALVWCGMRAEDGG